MRKPAETESGDNKKENGLLTVEKPRKTRNRWIKACKSVKDKHKSK